MIGIYLSGTGNTKYCVTKLVKLIDASADVVPLEDEFIIDKIKRKDRICRSIRSFLFASVRFSFFVQVGCSALRKKRYLVPKIRSPASPSPGQIYAFSLRQRST